ncbi:MAG: cobalamin B12-binding domain-containing protein [Gammaproteobacteria bacterium]|nr:cobalamin B12-binding domain-containing protein [Gammaproteobacteria bacterium]
MTMSNKTGARSSRRPRKEQAALQSSAEPAGNDFTDPGFGSLLRTIEADIIPRLLLAHQHGIPASAHDTASRAPAIGTADVERLTRLAQTSDFAAVWKEVDGQRASGVPLEAVFLDLLAPVARRLGKLWEQDLLDFTGVTIALMRLQQVMRELAPAFSAQIARRPRVIPLRILVTTVPGEQHRFGVLMVAEFFRRAGWEVISDPVNSDQALRALLAETHFDLLGLSLGSHTGLDALSWTIQASRDATLNRELGIMVGGPAFVGNPEYMTRVGADLTASDARSAVTHAENFIKNLESRQMTPLWPGDINPATLRPH